MKKDESVIPPGNFCYRLKRIKDGEVLSKDIARFGRDLREYSYNGKYKEILCPYWYRTDYGTVKCIYLEKEVVDEEDENAADKIQKKFGDPDAVNNFDHSWELSDEIKICGIRYEKDTEWID